MNPEVKHAGPELHKQESATPDGAERIQARKVYIPLVDIVETDQALVLVADMPGVDDKAADVTVEKKNRRWSLHGDPEELKRFNMDRIFDEDAFSDAVSGFILVRRRLKA